MVWVSGSDEERAGIALLEQELQGASDRAVAIIAGSLVEARLSRFLQANTKDDQSLWKERTHPSGPLGSFAVKIDLAFMFGMITQEARRDLIRVKDIRNRFAHSFDINSFDDQWVTQKAMALKLVDSYVVGRDIPKLIQTAQNIGLSITGSVFRIGTPNAIEELQVPKHRFVWSARVLNMGFAMRYEVGRPVI